MDILYGFTIIYIDNGLTVTFDQNEFAVEYGGNVSLSVNASVNSGDVSFQWYYVDENGDYVNVGNEPSLDLLNITQSRLYYCYVEDEYDNSTIVNFYVYIDSGMEQGDYTDYYKVEMGESVTLEAPVTVNEGIDLSYQWYEYRDDYGYELIPGASSDTYTTGEITVRKDYRCQVTDMYGKSVYFYYTIAIDSGLLIDIPQNSFYVQPGGSVTLSVNATVAYGEVYYQWYYEGEIMQGATDNEVTVDNITEAQYYLCWVSDDYDNSYGYGFYIYIDNGLSVNFSSFVPVVYGEAAELAVYATVDFGNIYYQWEYYDDEQGEYVILSETGSSLYLESVTEEYEEYRCVISDDYGNRNYAWFYTSFVEELYVSYDSEYKVSLGGGETLSVNAISPNGDVTYQWYVYDKQSGGYTEIEGETSASLEIEEVTDNTSYMCTVTDGVDTRDIVIYVSIDSGLEIDCSYYNYIGVAENESALLPVFQVSPPSLLNCHL